MCIELEDEEPNLDSRLNVKRGVYLWRMRACWWVPFIRTALKQMTDGDLPYPITTHMLFHTGVSAGWQPPQSNGAACSTYMRG